MYAAAGIYACHIYHVHVDLRYNTKRTLTY